VCLVEDDRNVLLATAALLEKWGCTVETHTSAQGLESQCDILVTDFDLGRDASGADCIEQLRRQRGWAVPALIITGHDVKKVQESLQDKQIPILSKPLRPAELRSVLLALRDSGGARRKSG
jgi:DNA-binding NtrC family response regulator